MYKFLLKLTLTFFIFFQGCSNINTNIESDSQMKINIIPKPVSINEFKETVNLKSFKSININQDIPETRLVAESLQRLLSNSINLPITVNSTSSDNIIHLNIDSNIDFSDEEYQLKSSSKNINLTAKTGAGLFYAFQSLRQLLPPALEKDDPVENLNIPSVEIKDHPRFSYRGMHLDVSRHFFPVEFIKTYIDMIAMHKMNIFHWHLTDDNGWRIEIERYPELTSKSAWRVDRRHQHWNEWSPIEKGEKPTYGGFYSKEEISEVIKYAADRHITIIPEIEMPGHTSEVFAAYPELSCKGDTINVNPGGYWPNIDIFCAGNDDVFTFLENVLAEVIELFPSSYIHIGGDEADKTHWESCTKCQKRIKDEGLADEHELQSWFIKKIEKFILKNNRKLVGWDEILEGGLAKSATVMCWRGTKGGIESAQMGHDVIMCPTSHCYFDYYQADPESSPIAIGGYTTLKKVYSYEPIPEDLTEEESKHILGSQGNLWTEYVQTPDRAQYRVLPRMTALSEVVWSQKESKDYNEFYSRLQQLQKRFDLLDWTTAPGSFAVTMNASELTTENNYKIEFTSEKPGEPIHYTLDGSNPLTSSPLFENPITIDQTSEIRAALFIDGEQAGKTMKKKINFHKALGKEVIYETPHKKKYAGKGALNLVDGLRGTTRYSDEFWQGWEKIDMNVIINLNENKLVNKITGSFLEHIGAWIFLPTKLEVSFSSDGKNFNNPKSVELLDGERKGKPNRQTAEINGLNENCQFIRIQAYNRGVCPDWHPGAGGKSWVFADEIIVE